ncbi:galactose/methyl galactoside ABC transporter permease MglC [Treponema brennaborense]|uniref:ABC-type transporter, integral membrane subunit n=1 Tax=Treponema brennaborense (strain DSM 12168 / CIP 105900 / DD5/3) TaxID=906968 RepID=F4LKE3_TREBD|nr:galactoside ABC transporter permease [Treponema brennaborense]AEE16517.1 ABC-type transporter, integral membrane subunit [Treponema brennaborense DSM 12168]
MSEKFDVSEVKSLDEDTKLQEYTETLHNLRKDGVNKIISLKQEIATLKKNKMVDVADKEKIIGEYKRQIAAAKKVAAANRSEENRLVKESVAYANALSDVYVNRVVAEENVRLAQLKKEHVAELAAIKDEAIAAERKIRDSYAGKTSRADRAALKDDIAVRRYEMKSELFDAKSRYSSSVERCKDAKNQAFIDHVQKNRNLRNGKTKFSEDIVLNIKDYVYKFKMSKFFLDNGLYLAILVFFIVCIVLAPLSGNGNLLSLPNIFTILEQSSTRMFYALGVAGLILLAGTDLSVGRMVALGAVVTGLILHPGMNIVTFFNMGPWNFVAIPMAVRVLMALSISVVLCVLFSSFAGVFSARLKIHPFISTLATQLIIYGLLFFGTSGTPVGSIDAGIKDVFGGRWIMGVLNGELITFPKLIIPAVIAIIVAWFIWNKTTFGKNMYAVGGNSEAASVSGISVFKVTMGVFIMAGIFYGFGAFFEAFKANASAGTGQGYELDAIAACVVGGISFNGGIGKIGGAVLGVIIFTGLTYCLTFLGIDTNLQFVFKGFIIIAAVALDSVKYLKRK